jgi:hypothetical protein
VYKVLLPLLRLNGKRIKSALLPAPEYDLYSCRIFANKVVGVTTVIPCEGQIRKSQIHIIRLTELIVKVYNFLYKSKK